MRARILSQATKNMITTLTFTSAIFFPITTYPEQLSETPSGKTTSFQKTDISLLYEIDTNLKTYDSAGSFKAPLPTKPPRQRRFELAKNGLHKLMYKNSMPNSLLGGTLGAIATAHPTGLVLGGIAGLLQGKSHRYEEAQGKIHLMEREIFASKPYEVTDEEIRLALYTGADLSEFMDHYKASTADSINTETPDILETTEGPENNIPKETEIEVEQEIAVAVEPSPPTFPNVDYCHDLAIGNTKPVDNATRRELATFCYYHLN